MGRHRAWAGIFAGALVITACSSGSESNADPVPVADVPVTEGTAADTTPATTTPAATTSTTTTSTTTTSTTTTVPEVDDELDINHVQVLGSHNSYHRKPSDVLFNGIVAVSEVLASGIEYSHAPLAEQLEAHGIRQFELDIFADPAGGLFANRASNAVVGLDPASGEPALDEPGYKVMHTQDFDYETTCLTLVACLTEIEVWSSAHPNHLPIMIMLEFKEQSVPDAAAEEGLEIAIDLPWAVPLAITPELLDDLEAELVSVFAPERMVTPDDVRGEAATLEEAVLDQGWPSIESSRGKVLFSMTDEGAIRDMYLEGAPSLEGRLIFTSSEPGRPDAAFVRIDTPSDETLDAVAAAGYLVRTRTDSPTDDARENNTARRDQALASGAHYLSTDYYVESEYFDSGYSVSLGGPVGRCNPVTAPPSCDADLLVEG